ncbi:amino acid ABC transporter substrate-binding protein [Piscinibacter sakaiensis]|uniref:amino acid ABC transporter substrate-binding protein n=1 Tax=Piscinibacter sakaiensis TaxID=1547922 RepID=UPI003AAC647F
MHRPSDSVRLRRRVVSAIAAAAATTLFGLPAQAQQDTITFGAALSLTGKVSTEGRLAKEGYDIYVEEINKRGGIKVGGKSYKVAIKYYDDQSDASTSVKLYEKLINEDGIKLLLGPYSSGITFAASAVTEKYQLPMVAAHAAATNVYSRGFKYLFATLTPVDQYTGNFIKMAAAANPRAQRVALIHENALFPQASIDAAERQAKEAGLEVVYKAAYPSGTKDFAAMVEAVKAARPDALIAAGYTGDLIVVARQTSEQKVPLKMIGFTLGPTLPGFVEALGSRAEHILEPVQWTSDLAWKDEIFGWTAKDYADLCKARLGHECDYHPPQSTAALEVYQRAIEKAGSLDPQKVRDALAQTNIMTAYGPVRFNERGQNIAKGMSVVQLQNGKPVVVFPLEGAKAKFIYPMAPR